MTIDPKHAAADPKRFYGAADQGQLTQRYDEAADVYEEAMSTDVGWSGHLRLSEAVARHVAPDARLLDAGAGTGMLGTELARRGFSNMDANDLSAGMLERARTKGIYGDCRVAMLGAALDELVRITRKGGLVCYTLRSDDTPPGFAEKHDALTRAGLWELVEAGEPFPSIASEPHIRHRCWIWRVL